MNKIIGFIVFVVVVSFIYYAYNFYNKSTEIQYKLDGCLASVDSNKRVEASICDSVRYNLNECNNKLFESIKTKSLCDDKINNFNNTILGKDRDVEFYKKSFESCKNTLKFINRTQELTPPSQEQNNKSILKLINMSITKISNSSA